MAQTEQRMKIKQPFTGKGGNWKQNNKTAGVTKKRKWVPQNKMFDGSINEGQGFAFKKKEKVRHEYNKILRKQQRKNIASETKYNEEYPEHLRHLYMAESEKLKNEAQINRVKRSKSRIRKQENDKEEETEVGPTEQDVVAETAAVETTAVETTVGETEKADDAPVNTEPTPVNEKTSLPMSNRLKKKMLRKTSYQRAKDDFERIQDKQRKKQEEYLKNKQQREEAIQKYKQKKIEVFQMLSKKTKKGQPNLNLQMEYLLQKIQGPKK